MFFYVIFHSDTVIKHVYTESSFCYNTYIIMIIIISREDML